MSKEHNDTSEITLEGDAAIELWLLGKEAWNKWVEKHPNASVSFEGVRFSYKSLEGKLYNKRVVFKDSELDLIDFSGFKFHHVTFHDAYFHGKVDFSSAQFLGSANFSKARFSVAIFSNSTFKDLANFTKASFFEKAEFSNVNFNSHVHSEGAFFQGSLSFDHSKVYGEAIFIGSKINGDCTFLSTTFHSLFAFRGVKVGGIAVFSRASFGGSAMFNNTTFNSASYFLGATFKDPADYSASIFQGDVEFKDCNFYGKSLNFKKCQFHEAIDFQPKDAANLNYISFEGSSFSKQLTISGQYNCIPDLRQTKTSHHIDLSLLTTKLNRHFLKNTGVEAAVKQKDADRLCRLKEIAESNKNHERALAFHADELRAKRWHIFNPWQSILDGLYSLTSNYGQSIMRPCMYLLASVFIFTSATLSQTKQSSYDITQMKAALTISVATATPFLAISKEARTNSTEELFNKELPDNYYLYSYIHSGSSFVFMFLIGLGLRNRFRI